MRWKSHVRFGGRVGETHPAKADTALRPDPYTKLRGPAKGIWFHLYVLIDIYSRYNPGWIVAAAEDSVLAKDFIDEAITRNGTAPHTVHADRGTSMTSKPVSALLVDLGVTRTHSRPRVSNDNPFSEAQFKTLKYLHDFPASFGRARGPRIPGRILHRVQPRSSAFRHRMAHSGFRALRHRRRGRRRPAGHPGRRAGRSPRTLRPTAPTTQIPDQSWINQPRPELQKT